MARIDDPAIYNPFGWRLSDLADPATSAERRVELREELLVWEAEELAHGYRHLTVSHPEPGDLEASERLTSFYDRICTVAACCAWVRVRGAADFVTVTVRDVADRRHLEHLTSVAGLIGRGQWLVAERACPATP
jgi:hypothetical protein